MKSFALIYWSLEVGATRPVQYWSLGPLANDDMKRYAASKLYTYKSALPAKGIYVRFSISISTPTPRKDNSHLQLMK